MLVGCLLITSCSKDKEAATKTTDLGLNGKWLSSGGTGVSIEGNTGIFYAFNPNKWTIAKNLGYVKLGDIKFKEITKEADNEWSFYELVMVALNGNIIGVEYSDLSTMKLSSDKKTLTLSTKITSNGVQTTSTTTYTKQ